MKLLRNTLSFSLGTILSRITGLIRDMVVVGFFGASALHDAFLVAFRIPNLFRDMLAEGALSNAFTKVYTEMMQQSPDKAPNFFVACFYIVFLVALLFCGFGIWQSELFVHLMTWLGSETNASPLPINDTILLTKILFPYLGLTMLGALAMGALHYYSQFFVSSFSSVMFNIGSILGVVALSPLLPQPILGLALGIILGGIVQLLYQMYVLLKYLRLQNFFNPEFKLNYKALREVFFLMLPASFAASTGPINLMINTNFATSLGTGTVTHLNYAFRLLQLPVGLFSVAIASVSLPLLTQSLLSANRKITDQVCKNFYDSFNLVLWLTVPSLCFLVFSRLPIIQILFQHGAFDYTASLATADVLLFYSFGIIGYGLIKVLTSMCFALGQTHIALYISVFLVGINFLSNLWLTKIIGANGLAVTTSITLSLNAILLLIFMHFRGLKFQGYQLLKSIGLLSFAFLISATLQLISIQLWSIPSWDMMTSLLGDQLGELKLKSFGITTTNAVITILVFVVIGQRQFPYELKDKVFKVLSQLKQTRS